MDAAHPFPWRGHSVIQSGIFFLTPKLKLSLPEIILLVKREKGEKIPGWQPVLRISIWG